MIDIHKLRVFYANIRGIFAKTMEEKRKTLHQICHKHKSDIIIITEWSATLRQYTSQWNDFTCPFKQFNSDFDIYYDTTDVALLIRKSITHEFIPRTYPKITDFRNIIHTCAIKITNKNKTYIIGGYYNSPTIKNKIKPIQFIEYVNSLIADKILFVGDMNLRHPSLGDQKKNEMSEPFIYDLNDTQFRIYNDLRFPTHIKGGRLDLLIGTDNQKQNINSIQTHPQWAHQSKLKIDHFPLTFTYQFNFSINKRYKYKTWNLNTHQWKKYKTVLNKHFNPKTFQWPSPNNLDSTWTNFLNLWLRIANSTVGKKLVYDKPTPWWTKKIEQIHSKIKRCSRKHQRKLKNLKKKKKQKTNTSKLQSQLKTLQNTLTQLKSTKQKLIRQAKTNLNKIISKTIRKNDNNRSFWKAINGFERQNQKFIPPLHNNLPQIKQSKLYSNKHKVEAIHKIIQSPPSPENPSKSDKIHYNMINHWFSQYQNHKIKDKYTPPLTNPFLSNTSKPKWNENLYTTPSSITNELYTLNKPLTLQELNICINELDTSKAMGPDSIHNKLIKQSGQPFRKSLLKFFNICWNNHKTPKHWHYDIIIPIPKPKKDHSHPKNYRPISISSNVGRLMQKMIAKRLSHFTLKLKIFGSNQSGFQMNRSCIDAILPLYQSIIHSQDIQSSTQLLQTDFSKAYDTVWLQGLIFKLYKIGIQGKCLKWLTHFVSNRITQVQYNNTKSNPFKQKVGLPQGSSLSPILYILYTNDFKMSTLGKKCLFKGCFADDTIFWNKPCTKEFFDKNIPKIIQYEFENFNSWATKWRLVLAPEKNIWTQFNVPKPAPINTQNITQLTLTPQKNLIHSQTIREYKRKQKLKSIPQHTKYPNPLLSKKEKKAITTMNTSKIVNEPSTIYLGIKLDEQLTLKPHTNQLIKGAYYRLLNLRQIIAKKLPINLKTYYTIYTSKTRSRIEYGIEIHNNKNQSILQILQNNTLRLILNLPKTTPIPLLHFLLHAPTINQRYKYYMGKLYLRTLYSHNNHPLKLFRNEFYRYKNIIQNNNLMTLLYKGEPPKKSQLNYYNRNPFLDAKESITNTINPINLINNQFEIQQQFLSALPCLDIPKPENLFFNNHPINKTKQYPETWNVFSCDGSAIQNPGKGAGSWIWSQHPKYLNTEPIFGDVTTSTPFEINYYELYTLHNIIQYLVDNTNYITEYTVIHCDSKNTLDWLSQTSLPNSRAIQTQIQLIYKKIHYINNNYDIKKIIIQKVKSHTNCIHHNIVDLRSKNLAKKTKYKASNFSKIPHYIQNNYLKNNIKKLINTNWKEYRLKKLNQSNTHGTTIRPIIKTFKNLNFRLLKYLCKIINHTDRGIITQLICNETGTNEYFNKFSFLKIPANNGHCQYCQQEFELNIIENIEHIIYKCPQYYTIRNEFRHNIVHLNPIFNDDLTFYEINNLFFPWMNENIIPKKSKDKISLHIWKQLIQFCKRTQNRAFDPKSNPHLR